MSTSSSPSQHKNTQSSQSSADPKANPEQAMKDAMTPGPENAELAKAAGTWKVAVTCWMKEGAEAKKSTGTSRITSVFDGRYTREEFSGEFDGKPFNGVGTMAYNRAAKRYESTWYDSMGTGIVFTSGQAKGKDIELTGEMTCPINGPMTLRQVHKHESADHCTITMYNAVKGKEYKSMELAYTRQK